MRCGESSREWWVEGSCGEQTMSTVPCVIGREDEDGNQPAHIGMALTTAFQCSFVGENLIGVGVGDNGKKELEISRREASSMPLQRGTEEQHSH